MHSILTENLLYNSYFLVSQKCLTLLYSILDDILPFDDNEILRYKNMGILSHLLLFLHILGCCPILYSEGSLYFHFKY